MTDQLSVPPALPYVWTTTSQTDTDIELAAMSELPSSPTDDSDIDNALHQPLTEPPTFSNTYNSAAARSDTQNDSRGTVQQTTINGTISSQEYETPLMRSIMRQTQQQSARLQRVGSGDGPLLRPQVDSTPSSTFLNNQMRTITPARPAEQDAGMQCYILYSVFAELIFVVLCSDRHSWCATRH